MPQQWRKSDTTSPGQYNNGYGYKPARKPYSTSPIGVTGSEEAPTISLTSSALFAQTATVTVANTVAETTIVGSGVGSLILPANFLTVGRFLKLSILGYHSAVANPTIDIKVKLNSTVILDTGAVTTANSTNSTFELRGFAVCRSVGVSGTVDAQGFWTEAGAGANVFGMVNTAPTTIDTTIAQTLNVTVTWGTASASNTISAAILLLESNTP